MTPWDVEITSKCENNKIYDGKIFINRFMFRLKLKISLKCRFNVSLRSRLEFETNVDV